MTDKKKRTILVASCCVLCTALAVGIGLRFSGNREVDSGTVLDGPANSTEPTVEPPAASPKPSVSVQPTSTPDPGQGADSTGTEQTIQADPVKPEAPEPPKPAPSPNHKADDVPEEERNTEAPPTYEVPPTVPPTTPVEPDAGSTNGAGQVYVPGFGYVQSGGAGEAITDSSIQENGNKVGIMG